MKEQVKTPGKELSEVEISSLPKKRVQGNDHKDALTLGEKGTILPKAIYRFNAIPIKIPVVLLQNKKKKFSKICMETQGPQIARAVLRGEDKAGGIMSPDFKLYCKAIIIKRV